MSQAKIYIGNLPYDATSNDLEDRFNPYGRIAETELITDRATGRSKGFAFLTFADKDSADAALAEDGKDLQGRPMKVSPAEGKKSSGRKGGGRGGYDNRGGRHHRR